MYTLIENKRVMVGKVGSSVRKENEKKITPIHNAVRLVGSIKKIIK